MDSQLDLRPGQSLELLKALHILTREGRINQDSRRKLKQVMHLYQLIEPLLLELTDERAELTLVDHGAGKSYLGFILYDLFFGARPDAGRIVGVEAREELVMRSRELADRLGFGRMTFVALRVAEARHARELPDQVDVVTALHACDTATDDAIHFALAKQARAIVIVPCCQAEVAAELRRTKGRRLGRDALTELWRHPLHTREFGSHITNVLRCLQLEAHGYQVGVTELVGWEHSLKNELIVARRKDLPGRRAAERLTALLAGLGLEGLRGRFFGPEEAGVEG